MTRNTAFDCVIVGARSAGCVLANRLPDRTDTTVLLLEAVGVDDDPRHRGPASFLNVLAAGFDWGTSRLRSADPLSHRLIDPNLYGDTGDLDDIAAGL